MTAVVAAMLVALALAACGGTSGDGKSSGTASNSANANSGAASGANLAAATAIVQKVQSRPAAITQTVALPTKPKRGTVVFITNGEPDTQITAAGTEEAAAAAGWNYDEVSYDASSPASLQQALLNALTKHPTVVTEAGTPPSQFGASVIARYKAVGAMIIPTSTYPLVRSSVIPVTSATTPNGYSFSERMGQVLAAWFVKNSDGRGKAVIPDVPGYPVLHAIGAGFEQETKRLCPACSVTMTTVSLSDLAAGNLVSDGVSAVQRAGADYLIFENGSFGTGAESALKAAGLSNVTIAGVSSVPAQIQALRDGANGAWVNYGFRYVGWATMDLAFRAAAKLPLTSNDANQPIQLVDPSNAKRVSEQISIPIPADGLEQFKKLWKVN